MPVLRKAPASVTCIDDARKGENPQPPSPASGGQAMKKRVKHDLVSRRKFLGLYFLFPMGAWKAARQSGHDLSDGEAEVRRLGYEAYMREREAVAKRAAA